VVPVAFLHACCLLFSFIQSSKGSRLLLVTTRLLLVAPPNIPKPSSGSVLDAFFNRSIGIALYSLGRMKHIVLPFVVLGGSEE
jgi:hypothetical protein